MIVITDHAYERADERLSLRKDSFKRLAEKAYEEGIAHSQMKGRLYRYCEKVFHAHRTANNIKIHGENIFLFNLNVLITVYQVPNELKKFIKINSPKKDV